MPTLVRLDSVQQFAAINLLTDPGAVPGPRVIPSCAEIVLVWALEDGKTAHNVLGGRYAGAYSGSTSQSSAILAGLTSGAAWTALAAVLAPSTALTNVYTRDINTANNPIVPGSGGGPPGTATGAALPNEVAACVTLGTTRTGPQNRGRMYIPGFATGALAAGNVISAAAVTAINNWANTITGVLSGQGYTWVLLQPHRVAYTSPKTGRQFPERLATSIAITTHVARDNHWDSQRRRGLK